MSRIKKDLTATSAKSGEIFFADDEIIQVNLCNPWQTFCGYKEEAPIEIGAVLIQYPMKNQSYDALIIHFVAKGLLRVFINFNQTKPSYMKTIQQWLSEYGESHQDHTNKTIHWICVPSIFFSIVGLLYSIKLPFLISGVQLNVAMIVLALVTIYYISLSRTLWIGLFLFVVLCLWLCNVIEQANLIQLWLLSVIIFVLAWIGQFYGHKVEGKKPSFIKDLQFLMIGPAWLMSFIYKKLGMGF